MDARARHVACTLAVVVTGALAACSDGPAGERSGVGTDAEDLAAAVAVWSDPWVAPSEAEVAGPSFGSDGQVSRVVARRTTAYEGDVAAAARAELTVAVAAGWAPTSSSCGTDEIALALARGDGALAQLLARSDESGTTAEVTALTRHHLDQRWPVPAPTSPASSTGSAVTCVDGGTTPPFTAPPLTGDVLGEARDEQLPRWSRTRPTKDDADSLEAARLDGVLRGLGFDVASPDLKEGRNRRLAPLDRSEVAATLADLVERAEGFRLTYAACGGGGSPLASFVGSVGERPAVITADLDPALPQVQVTLPISEGPASPWLDEDALPTLTTSPCLGDVEPDTRTASGVPAVLPTRSTPIAGIRPRASAR